PQECCRRSQRPAGSPSQPPTRQSIVLGFGPTEFDRNILALDEPCFLQSLAKRRHIVRIAGGRTAVENTDHRLRLLRPRQYWPCRRRAPNQCDELAPSHRLSQCSGPRCVWLSSLTIKTGKGVERNGAQRGNALPNPKPPMSIVSHSRPAARPMSCG